MLNSLLLLQVVVAQPHRTPLLLRCTIMLVLLTFRLLLVSFAVATQHEYANGRQAKNNLAHFAASGLECSTS